MRCARAICSKIEGGSTLLVIPKDLGVVNNDYLIEERLPLQHIPTFDQQRLYVAHQQELNPVICAFVHFIFQSNLSDLVQYHNKQCFPRGYPKPRFDNVPFFMTDEGLKIGLIDLETMKVIPKEPSTSSLLGLVYMYPYHRSAIMQVASSYFSSKQLEGINEQISASELEGKKLIQIGYIDLQTYLKSRRHSKICLTTRIKNAIIEEIKLAIKTSQEYNNPLTTAEEDILKQALDQIVVELNRVKDSSNANHANKGPLYCFNTSVFSSLENTLYYLEKSFYGPDRKILKGDGITLVFYLLQKLENHKVFYQCSINGFSAILVA